MFAQDTRKLYPDSYYCVACGITNLHQWVRIINIKIKKSSSKKIKASQKYFESQRNSKNDLKYVNLKICVVLQTSSTKTIALTRC
jgi:hypothetical protein